MVAACNGSDAPIVPAHDACAPLALVTTSVVDVQRLALDAAQSLWRDRGAPALGLRASSTLEVRFEPAAEVFHGLYDDAQDLIYINAGLEDPNVLAIVIAHELGHAFGLVHVTDRISIMNAGNLTTPPTEADQGALQGLWGTCM